MSGIDGDQVDAKTEAQLSVALILSTTFRPIFSTSRGTAEFLNPLIWSSLKPELVPSLDTPSVALPFSVLIENAR